MREKAKELQLPRSLLHWYVRSGQSPRQAIFTSVMLALTRSSNSLRTECKNKFATELAGSVGIEFDSAGNLYEVDQQSAAIFQVRARQKQ